MKYKIHYKNDHSVKLDEIQEKNILNDYTFLLKSMEEDKNEIYAQVYNRGQLHMFKMMCVNLGIKIVEEKE